MGEPTLHTSANHGWALPKNIFDQRYHFLDGEEQCLCGKYFDFELFSQIEERRPIISADARDCVAKWQERFEPTRRIYRRPWELAGEGADR
jgi:hypothetical protein